jgi:hypothetical protein
MCLEIYYEYSKPWDARSIAFLAVKGCVKGVLGMVVGYGKSPWFSRCNFFAVIDVDQGMLIFDVVDGDFLHE